MKNRTARITMMKRMGGLIFLPEDEAVKERERQ